MIYPKPYFCLLKGHYRVWDSGFRVSSLGLSVGDFGFRVPSLGFGFGD